MSKRIMMLVGICTSVVIVFGVYFTYFQQSRNCAPSGIIAGAGKIGGPFKLTNHKGKVVSDKDVIKGLTLVYFGYTLCPDICPLDMARTAEAVDILDAKGIDATPVFITIDPARDTAQVLADFVDLMHPKMIGLTGTAAEIADVASAYKTFYRKVGEGEDYLMDHMRFTYLMSPKGFLDLVRPDLTAEQVAEKVACYVN